MSERFKSLFSIIGPAMVGPSSSHTAGAVRLGRAARQLLGSKPEQADITLYGSFMATYKGHGTDLALAAGLLGCRADDPRIRDALSEAERAGIVIRFQPGGDVAPHPNTVRIALAAKGRNIELVGASIGGGNIAVYSMNGFDVRCSCELPALVLEHEDQPGLLAGVTAELERAGVNIGFIDTDRKGRRGEAMTVVETDEPADESSVERLRRLPAVRQVMQLDFAEKGGEDHAL